MNNTNNILITGATGFIGGFIVDKALDMGMNVWVAVRPSSSRKYLTDERINFIHLDFSNKEQMVKEMSELRFDYVVHAAGVTKCINAQDFYRVNTLGTKNLVEALLELYMPLKRFVYVSSLSVFGNIREDYPHKDIKDTDIPHPNTNYGKSKLESEKYLDELTARGKLPCITLRPTGVYGPREKDYFMMAKSISQHVDFAAGFKPQTITFVYVLDVVQAIFLALKNGKIGGKYFLMLAMSANYALFIPDDEAFSSYYVDPAYLGHAKPRALKFYYNTKKNPYIFCSTWEYDPSTGAIGDSTGTATISSVKTQLTDILNYHTVVLGSGETIGSNKYYKTKHGGEIMVSGSEVGSGAQIEGSREMSTIKKTYPQKNGNTYRINHVIEPPTKSVYKTLSDSRFSEFMTLCSPVDSIMTWAGISNVVNKTFGTSEQDKYFVFAKNNGLDDNVLYFNTYNYTVYAPNNDAMQKAHNAGLPSWDDIANVMKDQSNYETDEKLLAAKAKAKAMIDEINKFIRYHFQDNSVYVDNNIDGGSYQTACVDTLGIYQKLKVSGGSNILKVVDNRGTEHDISTTSGLLVNKMARDYVFDKAAASATTINTSSFAVIHELNQPLNYHTNTDYYNTGWSSAKAMKSAIYRYKKFLKAQSLKLHR